MAVRTIHGITFFSLIVPRENRIPRIRARCWY
jgi:hypothetical protein